GQILDANPELLRRVGMSLAAMQQKHYLDFFAGGDRTALSQAVDNLRAGLPVQGLELRAGVPAGETFDYEINAAPIKENGEVTAFLSVARDITQRKQAEHARHEAEAALRASEARYRSLVEHARDVI